jgi:hypothetical protein
MMISLGGDYDRGEIWVNLILAGTTILLISDEIVILMVIVGGQQYPDYTDISRMP